MGRARRALAEGGELYAFASEDAPLAARLLELGKEGAFGFVDGGADAEGPWLLRRLATKRLDALPAGERLPWREALGVVRAVARALAACERGAIFPGPLRPSDIALEPEVMLLTEPWLAASLGQAGGAASTSRPSPRWSPPEQADGAPWDGSANRYVLGLVAYRLLAGTHPFREGGLRHALRAQAAGEVPPFDEALARELRPGVQGFVLKMIDGDPKERPRDAAAIVRRCDELLRDAGESSRALPRRAAAPRVASAEPAPSPRPAREVRPPRDGRARGGKASAAPRAWVRYLPLGAGLGAALVALAAASAGGGGREAAAPEVPVPTPIARALKGTRADDCAPCHAREVAEWRGSVMAFAAKSPLYGALESAVEEQVGRSFLCPNGGGILRRAGADVCREPQQGGRVTGAGGEHWCVNCHAPGENLAPEMPAWTPSGDGKGREPMRDLLSAGPMEGISCAACHQTIGPVTPGASAGAYRGNPTWASLRTGQLFAARPEDRQGRFGIANSGYLLDPASFLWASGAGRSQSGDAPSAARAPHRLPSRETKAYLGSSDFCGACHDVRLFGTDVLGARVGETFKRLRNGYSEWRAWSDAEERAGRPTASCQGCHMSRFPGTCEASSAPGAPSDPQGLGRDCPPGTSFVPRAPGDYAEGHVGGAGAPRRIASHYFTSVDRPLADAYAESSFTARGLDAAGMPLGLRARRDMLLRKAFTFGLGDVRRAGGRLEIPVRIENTGAGHRVPAGFSQEREIWVELAVTDARGAVVYEVGRIATDDEDLRDKIFVRVNTDDSGRRDGAGRPLGVFGADVTDGPDVPRWSPNPALGGSFFRGRGLINFQNGFLRCVRCIGVVDAEGRCQPGPGQGATRADRYDDGDYDADTGECRSNLAGREALFETYFPIGALDASRGVLRAPDAIIDTRSLAPNVPVTYVYDVDVGARPGPFRVDARLRFRAFPPFLLRTFAEYEAKKSRQRLRPSGPQVTAAMVQKLDVVDLAEAHARLP